MTTSAISAITEWIDPDQLMALADATVKSSLLLLAALATIALGRKQSPTWRGWVLWLALLFVPVVYILSFLVPDWRWNAAFIMNGTPSPMESYITSPALPATDLAPMMEAVERTSDPALATHGSTTWPRIVFLIWALGTAAAGLWLLASRCRGMIARRTCPEVHRGLLLDALDHERLRAGLLRRPKLFVGEAWAMPATWGSWRPAILLPREAAAWSGERLRHVLWHELAHIVRRDALSSILAVPATILLWFHPLAWVARRLMDESREAACDDWVLTRGQAEPAAYSADLLMIVRQYFHRDQATTGLAMAQSSKVGNRVRRLLDNSISRAPLTTGQRLLLTAAGLMTLATTTLLISCRTTRPSTAETAAPLNNSPLPHGAQLITYEVHFIEKEPGVDWPGDQPLPQRCTAEQAAKILALMRIKRGLSIASYPKTTTVAGKEVDMRSLMAKSFERPRQPSEPAKDEHGNPFRYTDSVEVGSRLKLTGRLSRDWLNLDVLFEVKGIAGEKTFPGGLRAPVVGTVTLNSRIGLDDDFTCCFISGINPPGEKTGTELCIFVATSQSINP